MSLQYYKIEPASLPLDLQSSLLEVLQVLVITTARRLPTIALARQCPARSPYTIIIFFQALHYNLEAVHPYHPGKQEDLGLRRHGRSTARVVL